MPSPKTQSCSAKERRRRAWQVAGLTTLLSVAIGCAIDRVDQGERPELKGSYGGSGATTSGTATGGAGGAGGAGGVSSSSAMGGGAASSVTSSTASTVTSTSSGGSCTDFGEPNNTEATAHDLGKIDDCDGNGSVVKAALTDGQDVDWYTYSATDAFGCSVDPHRTLKPPTTMRMCKFAECFVGETVVSCKNSATPTVSPKGRSGCCHNLSFGMTVDCKGLADDANVFIRLDQGPSTCTEYSFDYHY